MVKNGDGTDGSSNLQFSVRRLDDNEDLDLEDTSLNLLLDSFTAPKYKLFQIKDFETTNVGLVKDVITQQSSLRPLRASAGPHTA